MTGVRRMWMPMALDLGNRSELVRGTHPTSNDVTISRDQKQTRRVLAAGAVDMNETVRDG